jgi:hypothetical protein
MTVASATGLPASGTFCLTILAAPGTTYPPTVILIFRVTSRAGAVLTGTAEGPDSNAASGSIVEGTILTVDAINQIKIDAISPIEPANVVLAGPASGASAAAAFRALSIADLPGGSSGTAYGFIQPLTAPVFADFTAQNENYGGAVSTVLDNVAGPVPVITIIQDVTVASPFNFNPLLMTRSSFLGPGFTITGAFTMVQAGFTVQLGIIVGDGDGNFIIFGINISQSNQTYYPAIWRWATSNPPSYMPIENWNEVYEAPQQPSFMSPLFWLRIIENSTNRLYQISSDGESFMTVYSEAVTTGLTTALYGWGLVPVNESGYVGPTSNVMMTLYSWAESHP